MRMGTGTKTGRAEKKVKKRKKPHKSCRCDVGNGADLGRKREKKRRQEMVHSVAADPDNL